MMTLTLLKNLGFCIINLDGCKLETALLETSNDLANEATLNTVGLCKLSLA